MNIVVCIKQVPDVDDIKWTPENNLDRSQMLTKINYYDDLALDCAINVKNRFKNATVTAISMGPMQAVDILNYAFAKGATRAILLCDKLFAGSDTLITAEILSRAIKKFVPGYDLILTGQMAQDGDTAQVPVSLAQKLDIVDVTNVVKLVNADKHKVVLNQKIDNIINVLEVNTPCLAAILDKGEEHFDLKIENYIQAQDKSVEIYNAQDIDLKENESGLSASPTTVYKVYRPESERNAVEIKENIVQELSKML